MQGLKTEQENQKIRVEIKELPAFDSPLRRKAFPNGDQGFWKKARSKVYPRRRNISCSGYNQQ